MSFLENDWGSSMNLPSRTSLDMKSTEYIDLHFILELCRDYLGLGYKMESLGKIPLYYRPDQLEFTC